MLHYIDYSELPRALQHMMDRRERGPKMLPRRSFLKLAGASGRALGAIPHIAPSQTAGTGAAASALKPMQQPSAFVQIATMAKSRSPSIGWSSAKASTLPCR